MSVHAVRNIAVFAFMCLLIPCLTHAATLRIAPSSVAVEDGETFSVAITVSTPDQAMNATAGVLNFPPNLLQVVSLSKSGSIVGVWVQEPSFSNTSGTVNFEGVALNPGYIGSSGRVLNVTLRAIETGTAQLSLSGTSVLANDGNGTEILTGTNGATIQITPATVRPSPAPTPSTPAATPTPEPVQEAPAQELQPVPQKTSIEKPYDISWLWRWADTPALSITLVILLLLILLFLILDALLFYLYLTTKKTAHASRAEKMAHRSFLLLRDDIDRYAEELKKESEIRKLTSLEEKFIRELKGDLTAAEKEIVREIRLTDSAQS